MSLQKVQGLVFHRFNDLGIDTTITILPENSPVCRFKIKGLQKSQKKNQIVSEIGSLVSLEYYYKQNRDVYNVKEIHLIERFDCLKSSYSCFIVLSYICEILNKMLNEGEIHKKEYVLFYGALNELNKNDFHNFFISFFLIRLLKTLGFLSIYPKCNSCMRILCLESNEEKIGLDTSNFKFNCSNCSNIFVDRKDVLKFLIDCSRLNFELIKKKEVDKNTIFIINQMLFNYVHSLGINLKSLQSLKSLL